MEEDFCRGRVGYSNCCIGNINNDGLVVKNTRYLRAYTWTYNRRCVIVGMQQKRGRARDATERYRYQHPPADSDEEAYLFGPRLIPPHT